MLKTQTFTTMRRRFIVSVLALSLAMTSGVLPAIAHAEATSQRQQLFADAAQEFHVPENILLAISYNESRWEPHGAQASADGGYGLMDLTTAVTPVDGKGTGQTPRATSGHHQYTLDLAVQLLHQSADTFKQNDQQNIRGAAAVLAQYAKDGNKGALPTSINDWYTAIAKYATTSPDVSATNFADDVYATLKSGAALTTLDGQFVQVAAANVAPNKRGVAQSKTLMAPHSQNNDGAECPKTLDCRFVSAGYAQNSSDPADYGNYDHANRPKDMDIKYIYIHDTEGSYDSAINHFIDTTSYVSANYVIRSSDGAITQMVRNEDVSWGIGDWYDNMHGINIEHEGFAADGATWYTEAMYKSSATLVKYLANKYNIPLDRQHILGHDNIPTISPSRMPGQHWDTGPYWDWNHYMALVHGVNDQQEMKKEAKSTGTQKSVTIEPRFQANKQVYQDCTTGTCTTLPAQASSAVAVRTQPDLSAPLMSDKYVHSDGSAGTNKIDDWGAVAATGQQFAFAGHRGDWTAIWYGGQKGWIYNPKDAPTAKVMRAETITPKAGKTSIPVFGAAYPEASAYPADGTVPVQNLQPLYTIPAGQSYTTTDEKLPTDYFYDATVNSSLPHDHMIVVGHQKYYQINFNHRIGYVLASDVKLER